MFANHSLFIVLSTVYLDHWKFSVVFEETITIECFFDGLTIAINGFFPNGFWSCYHRFQWFGTIGQAMWWFRWIVVDRCGLGVSDGIVPRFLPIINWRCTGSCVVTTHLHIHCSVSIIWWYFARRQSGKLVGKKIVALCPNFSWFWLCHKAKVVTLLPTFVVQPEGGEEFMVMEASQRKKRVSGHALPIFREGFGPLITP